MREQLIRHLQHLMLHVVAKSAFLCSAYYALCSTVFWREHRGVVCGRLKHIRQIRDPAGCQYLLRRNVHLLEKALVTRPRRNVFALDYIEQTVAIYGRALRSARTAAEPTCPSELSWAADVLTRYFDASGAHPIVDELRHRFRALQADFPNSAPLAVPAEPSDAGLAPVEYGELLALARRRRSVRWFLPKPVPRELIDRAVAVAAFSPSACNLQPFEFRVFDEPRLTREIASLPPGTSGFGPDFPAIAVLIGKLHAWPHEPNRHLVYIDASLAAMAFVLALETQGLGTCCLNWPDLRPQERRMARLLGLEPDERVILLIALGYPDPEGPATSSPKKPLAELRSFNRTG